MTCSELTLETVLGLGVIASHDAGIVYQDINVRHVGPAIHNGSRLTDLCEGLEIQSQCSDWDVRANF